MESSNTQLSVLWICWLKFEFVSTICISQTNTFPHEGSKNLEELLGNRPPAIPPNWLGTFQPRQHPTSYHGLEGLVHNWRCMPVSKWAITMIISILTADASNHINYYGFFRKEGRREDRKDKERSEGKQEGTKEIKERRRNGREGQEGKEGKERNGRKRKG